MPHFGSAFGTFLMRQAFLSVPKDLVEAGVMDGCRWYHLLWNVYLPPSYQSLVAFGLVSVSFHWNELLWPLVVTSDKARPLTMGLLRFTQLTDIGAQWALVMAATMIIIAPLESGDAPKSRQRWNDWQWWTGWDGNLPVDVLMRTRTVVSMNIRGGDVPREPL